MSRWRGAVLVAQGWGPHLLAVALCLWALNCHEALDQRTTPPVVLIADSTRPFFDVCRLDEHGVPRLVSLPLIVQPSAP